MCKFILIKFCPISRITVKRSRVVRNVNISTCPLTQRVWAMARLHGAWSEKERVRKATLGNCWIICQVVIWII